jgi:hypothetical protein
MMKALVRALALVVYASRGVEPYPFGSVACDYGNAAVHDLHSNAGPGNLGLIENGGIELSFDDVVVDPRKPFTLTPGHNYTVALTAPSNKPFLGFMLILRSDLDVDTSKSITPGTEGGTQPSLPKVCPDHVGAVGHSWNNKKYKATAHIKLDTSTPYALDNMARTNSLLFFCPGLPIQTFHMKDCLKELRTESHKGKRSM